MSNKQNLSPKRAAQYSAFQAKFKQRMDAIAGIWAIAQSKCEQCKRPVLKPGVAQHPERVGSIRFIDHENPTIETGRLFCWHCRGRVYPRWIH